MLVCDGPFSDTRNKKDFPTCFVFEKGVLLGGILKECGGFYLLFFCFLKIKGVHSACLIGVIVDSLNPQESTNKKK